MAQPRDGAFLPFGAPAPGTPAPSPRDEPSPAVEGDALRALKEALANVPHEEKASLVHAQRLAPGLVDDEHLRGFLWAENFDVDLALARLVRYWEQRRKVFGDKFALPLTLNGALRDDIDTLKLGFLTLLPVPDEEGRAIIYYTNEKNPSSADEKIRVLWYLLHVAMEDRNVAKKGYVILAKSSQNKSLSDFQPKWALALGGTADRVFPIRWRMGHVLHANATFPFISNAIKAVLNQGQRRAFILHNGSDESVRASLAQYGLPKRCLPTDLDGPISVSMDAFVKERLAIEGGASASNEISESVPSSRSNPAKSTLADDMTSKSRIPSKVALSHVVSEASENSTAGGNTVPNNVLSNEALTGLDSNPFVGNASTPSAEDVANALAQTPAAAQKKKRDESNLDEGRKRPRPKAHPGRHGDPRMNLAVETKIANPSMTHADALIAAGYVFPDVNGPGKKLAAGAVVDADGVSLYQRRNQLIRRLRLVRKKLEQEM
ncbi:hypothetical protein ACHAXT_001804 [Thalassiosira profunda]